MPKWKPSDEKGEAGMTTDQQQLLQAIQKARTAIADCTGPSLKVVLPKYVAILDHDHRMKIASLLASAQRSLQKAEKELFDLFELADGDFTFNESLLPALDLLPLRVDVSKMLLRVTQDRDEKGEYDFDSTGIRLDIPKDF